MRRGLARPRFTLLASTTSLARSTQLPRGLAAIPLLVLTAGPGVASNDQISNEEIPAVGALVRVVAPRLGTQWRIGVFNRLRVEPPCYRVVLFPPDGSNRVTEILTMKELERLQVNLIYDGGDRFATAEVRSEKWTDADWRDLSLEVLRQRNLSCPP